MYNPLQNAGIFLIKTIFNIYIYLVLIRFFLQILRADFYNPICQFIVKATNPLLLPLRRFTPSLLGLDMAAIILLILLELVQLTGLSLITTGKFLSISILGFSGILVWIIGQLLDQSITLFTFAIIMYAIISWFPQAGYNPISAILNNLCVPILRITKRIIPISLVGGIDLSPLFALVILQLLNFLLSEPLIYYSRFLIAGQ